MKCKICGNRLDDGATKCPMCGSLVGDIESTVNLRNKNINVEKCLNCGKEIVGEHRYCPHCNSDLESLKKERFESDVSLSTKDESIENKQVSDSSNSSYIGLSRVKETKNEEITNVNQNHSASSNINSNRSNLERKLSKWLWGDENEKIDLKNTLFCILAVLVSLVLLILMCICDVLFVIDIIRYITSKGAYFHEISQAALCVRPAVFLLTLSLLKDFFSKK